MAGKEITVFQSSSDELQDVLVSEKLSDTVANTLYQSKGIISLEDVQQLKAITDEKEKAGSLIDLLHYEISCDRAKFEDITKVLSSYDKLKPMTDGMEVKLCKSSTSTCTRTRTHTHTHTTRPTTTQDPHNMPP